MKNTTSPKETRLDYNSNERTKDSSQSPTNYTKDGKKEDLDFENCDVYIKKPNNNNRERSAYRFLEESFNTTTGPKQQQVGGNANPTGLENVKAPNKSLFQNDNAYKSSSPENNNISNVNITSTVKNEKISNDVFLSRRKNKVTKTLDNNDFDF